MRFVKIKNYRVNMEYVVDFTTSQAQKSDKYIEYYIDIWFTTGKGLSFVFYNNAEEYENTLNNIIETISMGGK